MTTAIVLGGLSAVAVIALTFWVTKKAYSKKWEDE